ncbi:hypothetical protein GCM10022234_00470 [Aeromicrobium panaciterrae]|uniref:hypothetical protein n=1 Tax=Aeromicrobium panaciterrae TaxID=363861 RepID=UPI0031DC1002
MTYSNMTPGPIPDQIVQDNPDWRALHIGPPPGVSDEDCGTVEAFYGLVDGMPCLADFWRPTPEQLAILNAGGFLELRQYTGRMVMHSLIVHADRDT